MIALPVVLAGVACGGGLAIVIAGLLPNVPDLRSAVAHLESGPPIIPGNHATSGERAGGERAGDSRWQQWSRAHLPRLAARMGLGRYRADLDLVGEAPETLIIRKLGYAVLGLGFPPALATTMALVGLSVPFVLLGAASLGLATALFLVPDFDLHRRATATRGEMRRAVCVYLELVALERVADAGTVEALNRAAGIGHGRAFSLIRAALLRAQLSGAPPWQGLTRLTEELRVPELGDVADIMRLSGEDGAAVYATLRARAASLRTALLTDAAAEANAASEHMIMPVAFLGVTFMALLGYPAFARILFG